VRYRFILSGEFPPKALSALQPVSYSVGDGSTGIEVDVIDDAHLHGVIEQLNRFGAHLEGIQQIDVFGQAEAPSPPSD
jgi:hypothetical protein